MKTPGPDHPITIEPARNRWRARFAGHVIADSNDTLILREKDYPPVVYFPRAGVSMEFMSRTDRSTYCPYKGDAAYYTVLMDGQFAQNAAWTYELPYPAMEAIGERLAFYTNKIEVYEVPDAAVNPRHREAPADNTSAAQQAPRPANVDRPAANDDGGPQ